MSLNYTADSRTAETLLLCIQGQDESPDMGFGLLRVREGQRKLQYNGDINELVDHWEQGREQLRSKRQAAGRTIP